jgi:prolyl-tRNA synthetase
MVRSEVGEDLVASCDSCSYAANLESATSVLPPVADPEVESSDLERFDTPGVRTIADLEVFDGGAAADHQIKTLVYVLDGESVLVLLRGDHALQQQKLLDQTRGIDARPAQPAEIVALLGADAGSLGAVGLSDVRILADHELKDRRSMTTGANENDVHLRGVDVERDIAVTEWMDLRTVAGGEACPVCGGTLSVFQAIEVGHIFKLGTFYAEPLGVKVLDRNGSTAPVVMGSYGIGVERNMAASVEANHDEKGIVWPMEIAPFPVIITVIRPDDEAAMTASLALYESLREAGIDVLLDDRDERPGVKFTDAELIGIPFRVTIGPRGLAAGIVEVVERRSGESREIPVNEVHDTLVGLISA